MDKKLTDSEIVKALERCADGSGTGLIKATLDLINRQKAEIKKLTSGKCVYLSDDETTEYCVEGPCPNYKTVAQIKAEAYKEFANELKCRTHEISYNTAQVVTRRDIDNLLKELEGDSNARILL